jgi:hypothetical protein
MREKVTIPAVLDTSHVKAEIVKKVEQLRREGRGIVPNHILVNVGVHPSKKPGTYFARCSFSKVEP